MSSIKTRVDSLEKRVSKLEIDPRHSEIPVKWDTNFPTATNGIARKIKLLVCAYYELKPSELDELTRTSKKKTARQIVMYLCRKHIPGCTFQEIGTFFGRHHSYTASAVIHACGQIDARIKSGEVEVPALVASISKVIGGDK